MSSTFDIHPPSKENGDEPLFRVIYIIDVNASDTREAAEFTYHIITDPKSLPPILQVMDCNGTVVEIDLSKDK